MTEEKCTIPNSLDIQAIMKLIPHRYPMLLVDRILAMEKGKNIVGIKNVSMNESFFQGHFPGKPVMPGVLLVEAMAQTGGVLLMHEFEDVEKYVVFFITIDKVKFRNPVEPGDQVRMEVEVTFLRGSKCRMKGKALVDGKLVASAEFAAVLVKKDEEK